MTQHRTGARCENRSHPPPLPGQEPVPDRVDAAMDRVELPTVDAGGDCTAFDPPTQQLAAGDEPVLNRSQIRDQPIGP